MIGKVGNIGKVGRLGRLPYLGSIGNLSRLGNIGKPVPIKPLVCGFGFGEHLPYGYRSLSPTIL